jgi:DNA-binding CsgD family transcriptional regulator
VLDLLIGRVALVVAIREGDEQTATTLQPLAARGVVVVRLDGLTDLDAIALTTRLRPELSPRDLRRLVRLAGGNPLLIEELALRGQASSSLTRAILGQLSHLPAPDREALELIAIAGRPLPERAVGASAGELVERGLLRAVAGGLEVRHRLVTDAIVEHLDAGRRQDLHERLGEIVDDPVEQARHLASARRHEAAFEVARTALESAVDPRARALLLGIAAEAGVGNAAAYRLDAAVALGALGDSADAIALLESPIEGDDEIRARAAAALAGALRDEGRQRDAWPVIDGSRALRPSPGSLGAVALIVAEAALLMDDGRLAEAIELVEGARATGTEAAGEYRLRGQLAALRLRAGEAEQLPALEASVGAALAAGDGGTAAGRAMDLYAATLALRGGAAAAAVALDWADRLAALGYGGRANELRAEATRATTLAGDLANAVARADALLDEPLRPPVRQRLAANRGLALALLGHIDEADRALALVAGSATAPVDGRAFVLASWAEACLWGGQPERALKMTTASLGLPARADTELALTSLTRAWAEVELGRDPTPVATDDHGRLVAGAAPELRGLLARARGQHGLAAGEFDEAARRWSGFHLPRELVCRWAAGDALQRAGDQGAAIERLRAVEARAVAIGFEALAARTRRSIRIAGERTGRSGAADRSRGLLTRREREVLGLVERGLTNAEIARRISLGRPTVARLLSNAMLKLGAESRAQAVVLAARHSE